MQRSFLVITNASAGSADDRAVQAVLDVLRGDLRLTGTKEGCAEGECGACTVLLDGRAVNACLVLCAEAEGHEVTTVEGLSAHGPTDLQEEFLTAGAVQCGFCIPGQIVSAEYLLRSNPSPSEQQIRDKVRLVNDQGWLFVSINYRLTDPGAPTSARFPDHFEDVAAAVAWVHEEIGAYGGDPERLALLGHSAGADIIANVAAEPSYLAAEGLDDAQPGDMLLEVGVDDRDLLPGQFVSLHRLPAEGPGADHQDGQGGEDHQGELDVDGQQRHLVGIDAVTFHGDVAARLELPGDGARACQLATGLGEDGAYVGRRAVAVVGRRLDQDGYAARAVALVDDLLDLLALARPARPLHGPLDVVGRHVHGARLLDGHPVGPRVATVLFRLHLAGKLNSAAK